MSIANNQKIIIAAINSRPYVKAAVAAGYEVIAIDVFSDVDLQEMPCKCYQVGLSDNQLDSCQLLNVLDQLDFRQYVGFCYGAGFEKNPSILDDIEQKVPLLGNAAKVVKVCKTPDSFFSLCDHLALPYPLVTYDPPLSPRGWIKKEVGGSGGGHINYLCDAEEILDEKVYYQQLQRGKAISCLFLVCEGRVQVVGFNEQWLDVNDSAPFRYGGAVNQADINEQAKERFTHQVIKLSNAIGLVGINSCDAICDGNEVYLLEINPRLSASMDLYEDFLLMEKHVDACLGQHHAANLSVQPPLHNSHAHQVLYAKQSITVKEGVNWPSWVRDVPEAGNQFSAGMPVCTVVAEGETASLAKALVHERAIELSGKLLN